MTYPHIMGSSVFWQLEFWHRALSAYGNLSIGILAYGILSIAILAYSILAMQLSWHSQIIVTAWTFNCVNYCFFHLTLFYAMGSMCSPSQIDNYRVQLRPSYAFKQLLITICIHTVTAQTFQNICFKGCLSHVIDVASKEYLPRELL